jgi:hypothetical protein
MNDYGFRPYTLFGIILTEGTFPKLDDKFEDFNQYEEDLEGNINTVSIRGNSNIRPNGKNGTLNWDSWQFCGIDVRMFYAESRDTDTSWTNCRW